MDKKRIVVIFTFILIFVIAIILSIVYYNDKYSVYFETGTNDILLTKYVKRNGKIEEPITPTKDGYVFKEWQLNGKKYDFDSGVESDTVLTAKWVKEEYVTINFETGTNEKIESMKVLKGEKIDNLPIINRDNYEFLGWFLYDSLYNNEEVYDDITLIAKYQMNKINNNYNVGDIVEIIGKYSESAYKVDAIHSKAIGWKRKIIAIIEDGEYPYMVGNEYGVTGFFKAESLSK